MPPPRWARLTRVVFVRALTYTPSKKIKRSDARAWLSTGTGLEVLADIGPLQDSPARGGASAPPNAACSGAGAAASVTG
ncbi:hypothetical protein [Streptomyces sp. NPDC059708]|uniref:hypothetical protein n=1 Tax=Streptomyces sp. NPDC059708 TaxID=3346916 RepID=UPI0036C9957A